MLLVIACMASSAQAATTTLFAAPGAPDGGFCPSPAQACSIGTAVERANEAPTTDAVEIKLAGGAYEVTGAAPTDLPITFAGPRLTLEPESAGAMPILDGGEGATNRVLSVDAASTVTIDGLTIENGNTAGLGGGIENKGALTVRDSTFTGNTGSNGGAIANIAGATLTVEDSTLSGNTAVSVGGGAIIALGTVTVERSALIGNHVPINGGAINVQPGGSLTVVASTLSGNVSGSLGGAISNLGTLYVVGSTIVGNSGSSGAAIAAGNKEVTFAADIIGAQTSGEACSPSGAAFVDAGYNLDVDGTCISPTTPGPGSHNGTTEYGSSTYGEVLESYLADEPADNGGPTRSFALLSTPNPPTALADPAFEVVPPTFELPTPIGEAKTACALPDQRGYVALAGANCGIGSFLRQSTTTAVTVSSPAVFQGDTVTYTATVTPAPDGGTVAFDDGAGNPATAQCSAQSVVGGKATCTVSYSATGDYSAKATYSGDGNGFVGSTTAASAKVTVKAHPPVPPPPPTRPKVKLKIRPGHNHPHARHPRGATRYIFHFTSQGVGVTFYCRLDKAPFKRCRSPKTYRNLKRGRHVFKVKARDAVGQYSPVKTVKFVVRRPATG